MMGGSPLDRRGFALPAVIFLVALLTLLLTAGLSRVQVDRQIAEASEASDEAFAIAESGLQNYMGTRTTRPADGDSVRINMTGGYANVISRLVRNPSDTTENALYLVRSTGMVINPLLGSAIQAQRTVAQFADWQTGSIERRAALTAPNGLWHRDGSSGTWIISGSDQCGVEPDIPAVRTTTITAPSPPTTPISYTGAVIEEGNANDQIIAQETEIDWTTVTSSSFVPDYTSFQNGDLTGFSIQRLSGTFTVSSTRIGSGILIVPGVLDLDPGAEFYFRGIILVGSYVDFDAGFGAVEGLVYSGMDEQLALDRPRTEFGASASVAYIRFHSCYVNQALAALTGMAPVPNAWLDSWARY